MLNEGRVVGTLEDLEDCRERALPNLFSFPVYGKHLKLARLRDLAIHCARSVSVRYMHARPDSACLSLSFLNTF